MATLLFSQTRIIPVKDVQTIADRNAASLWGDVSPAEVIPYYNAQDEIIGYRFNYAIGKGFPSKQSIVESSKQAFESGDKIAQWGIDEYGNMLVSARTDMAVIQDYSKALSPEYSMGYKMEEMAKEKLGSSIELKKVYYINFQNQWFCYTNGIDDIYINVFPRFQAVNYQKFHEIVDPQDVFCATGDFSEEWDQYLNKGLQAGKAEVWIPNHDGYCKYYDWSYGCSPCAASMLLSWWDFNSINTSSNYANLVDRHFARWDGIQGEMDYQVPNVNKELAIAMNTDTVVDGGTARSDIAPGYDQVCDNNGYNFVCTHHNVGDDQFVWYFNKIASEVGTYNRPIHISIPGHSEACVAYDAATNLIGVHNTWWSGVQWISRTQLERVYTIVPGGATGYAINLEHPQGDILYNHNGSGETFYAGDVCEIRWDYDYSAGSYVRIIYSTNGGNAWTYVTTNTPNDGVYDWVIPSGINSTTCRIWIAYYNSADVYSGSDGSLGNFKIYSGGSLYTLSSDVKVNTATDPDYYQFNNPYSTWCAVGVRNNTAGDNWSMRMYSNNSFTTELVSSSYTYPVDFVVLDRHHYTALSRGIKAYRFSGTGTASVEFEGDQETMSVGTSSTWGWTAGDVVEMFDVYLTPGIYGFKLDILSGTADLDFGLFGSTDAVYYKNRNSYLAQSITSGGGVDEYFTFTVTTADYYGLCLWGNDANSATYNVTIERAGTWTGLGGTSNWHVANNWSALTIPDATLDVTIPAGTPYNPGIWLQNAYCNSITIETGASLSVYDDSGAGETLRLYVTNDMNVSGYIYMWGGAESYDGEIQVGDDITWNSGSRIYTTANNQILRVYGDWYMESGAEVHMDNGIIMFMGSANGYIESNESTCYLNNVSSYKTGGAHVGFSYLSTSDCYVNGDMYIQSGAAFNGYNTHNVYLQGDINNHGTFIYNYGALVMTGSSQYIRLNTDCYVNNLTVNSTGSVYFADTYSDTLTVKGNVQIDGGALNCGDNIIQIAGQWTNNVGTAGFLESTGRVVFNKQTGGVQFINSSEHFNILECDAPIDGIRPAVGTDVLCNIYDWTSGGVSTSYSTFTANDLADNSLYGKFYALGGSQIILYEPTSFIDLFGDILVQNNGLLKIYGGGDDSWWATTGTTNNVTVAAGGVLEFVDKGIHIFNTGTLNESINGTIKTGRHFICDRTDFNASGGVLEFHGGIDASFNVAAGSTLYDVLINKSGGDKSVVQFKDRDGTVIESTKSNSVTLYNDVEINNDLTISEGSFILSTYTANIDGDCNINAFMDVGAAGNVINHGLFDQGATGTLNIAGGSFVNDHPYGTDAWQYLYGTLNLSAGLFEMMHNSIYLGSTFIDNISGGTIRTGFSFSAMYAGTFEPSGGNVEFTGTSSLPRIECNADVGNYFNNFDFNSVSDYVLFSNTEVRGDATINMGTLGLNFNELSCYGNVAINSGGVMNINQEAILKLDNGSVLNVAVGGEIQVLGSAGNKAIVTHISTGTYPFYVYGTIAAEHAIFEYMDGNGVNVRVGGIVEPAHAFNNCAFQNGAPAPSALLSLHQDQTFTSTNAYFENSVGTGYNVWKYENNGNFTFVDAWGDFDGEDFDYDPYNHVHWTYTSRTIDLTVFIEGPFNPSSNKMNLGINSILPLNQPFDTPPLSNPSPDWYYTGTESVASIPNAFIVDWVLVEFRDAPTVATALPGTAISTQAAFIRNTGEIVGLDGLNPITFTGAIINNLYAVVWTRNHVGIISANPLVEVGGLYTYDFSSGSGQAVGGTAALKQLSTSPVMWGIKSGDANGTGVVAPGDKTNVWTLQAGDFGYLESDYNYDGQADNIDKNDYWVPNMGASSFIPE